MPILPENRGRTIEYGDRPGITVSHDRAGLPADCPCPAVRYLGGAPHIGWPEPDCRHHGLAAYGLPIPDAKVLPFRRPQRPPPAA